MVAAELGRVVVTSLRLILTWDTAEETPRAIEPSASYSFYFVVYLQ